MTKTIRGYINFFNFFRIPLLGLSLLVLSLAIIYKVDAAYQFADNFDDGVMNTENWKYGVLTRDFSHFDPQVQVSEGYGRLVITPRANLSGTHYNGYIGYKGTSLVDSFVAVEVVQRAATDGQTIFSIGLDKNNFLRFRAKGKTLYLENGDGAERDVTIPVDNAAHRFWRFRHTPATDKILFETSPDSANWTVRKTSLRTFPITGVIIEMNAGTSAPVSTPGNAVFDNFAVVANSSSPTPTTPPAPTPAPTATPVAPPPPAPSGSISRGYLTTPPELVQIKSKADQGIEPYRTSVNSLLARVGSPSSWSYGVVDPTNRDLLNGASAMLYAKSMAYHLTGNPEYAALVRQKILEISTTRTCADEYSGGNGCILTLSRHISAYIAAADLIEGYSGWTAADKQMFQFWLRDQVYRFTDWASDERSTNWGSVGSATTQYIADYFANSGLLLIDRSGKSFTPRDAYMEARQRALDRNNSNPYMYNSVCSQTTGLGIQPYGGIPEETGRDTTGCWGTYLLTNDSSYSYMIAHLSGTVLQAELLWRRGDKSLYDNIKPDGGGSIMRAILYVIENPNDPNPPQHSFDWIDSRKSILEIAYRYYRHPAIAKRLGIGTSNRNIDGDGNTAMPHFGTLTHGFATNESPAVPLMTAAP